MRNLADDTIAVSLADRNAIIELRHRYGRALDERAWPAFASTLADTVDADFSQFGIPAATLSRQGVVELMRASFRDPSMRSHQLYTNFEISITGDRATSTCSLVGEHRAPGTPGGDQFTLHARYHDVVAKAAGTWQFVGIRLEVLFTDGNIAIVTP